MEVLEKLSVLTTSDEIENEDLTYETPTTEHVESMVYETTPIMMEYFPTEKILFHEETSDEPTFTAPVYIEDMQYEETAEKNQLEPVESKNFHQSAQLLIVKQAMYNPNNKTMNLEGNLEKQIEEASSTEMPVKENDKLDVNDKVDANVKLDMNDKVDVDDKLDVNDKVDVNEKVDVNDKMDVNEKLDINDRMDVNDILDVNDNLDVNEKLDKSDIEVSGAFNGYFQPEIVKDFNYIKPLIINEGGVIEEVSTFDYPAYEIEVYEDNYPEYIIYEDIEPIETKEEVILPPNPHISIPDNNIDQEALDPNQILPRVAVECFDLTA